MIGMDNIEKRMVNYILHELLADRTDILAERGTEHHHLFLMWGHSKDLLYV